MHDANTIMRTGNVRSFHIASTGFACPARNYLYACCVKLLRWLFKPIDQLLDRVFSVAGAVVLSQMPQIMRQYLDVLSGALAEAGRNVAVFRDQAFLLGKSLPEFIDKHLRNPDPDFQASGRAMQQAVLRLEDYEAAYQALNNASPWERPFLFVYHLDGHLWGALQFSPGLPLNLEGLAYALAGILLGLACYHGIVRMPVYLAQKFRSGSRSEKDRQAVT